MSFNEKNIQIGDYVELTPGALKVRGLNIYETGPFKVIFVATGFFETNLRTWKYRDIDKLMTRDTNPEMYL